MLSAVSNAIPHLESLVQKTESIAESIYNVKVCRSKEQYSSLEALGRRLQDSAAKIAGQIERLEEGYAAQIREEGRKFLSQAETTRASIIQNNQLRSIPAFRKNIALIFEGPRDSSLDPGWITSRNKQTRIRCELIRELNTDGVISWAAALAPSVWTAGCMQNHVFDYLIEEMEPEEAQAWPPKIGEILHVFGVEESFAQSQEYREFLKDFDSRSGPEATQTRPRKRRRTEVDTQQPEQAAAGARVESATELAGDVYKLTPDDAPNVITEIRGQIWLTDPYDANNTQPFVTVPISWKLRDQFISQRPRMM